ncbi:AMP-dependent synthetase/ligase [Nocardia fluminea]|uniref:AMP-dependent synthetase/ligase n=1 Tax=Nocardia fluminea TaxID=134984 RepID=UPI00366F2930
MAEPTIVSATAPAPLTERTPVSAATLVEAFQLNAEQNGGRPGLRTIGGSVELTWAEVAGRVEAIAGGLWGLGVRKGDTVAILATNSVENHLVDYAIAHLGGIPFGIFNSSSKEQIAYQIGFGGARLVVTERQFLDKVRAACTSLGDPVVHVVVLDDVSIGAAIGLAEVEESVRPDFDFEATWRAVGVDDLQCLIYTSGTTGPPKAVEWSNRTVMAQLRGLDEAIPVPANNVISFLPLAHAGGRVNGPYSALVHGAAITVCPVMNDVPLALVDARPDALFSSPRLFEKLQVAIDGLIDSEPDEIARASLRSALDLGLRMSQADEQGSATSFEMTEELRRDRSTGLALFHPLLQELGLENLAVAIIGGAPVAADVVHYFRAVGVPMLEAYGATETSLNVFNLIDEFKTGTAGKALPGVELTLGPDNELLARSDMNMVGYRNEPEKTAETIDADGWVHTGDIATIDADGFVKIVDRKKEIMINSAGKNMSPANIEMAVLGQSTLIGQVVAIGEGRRYVTALVTLDTGAVSSFVTRKDLTPSDDYTQLDEVRAEVARAIDRGNAVLNSNEQIEKFEIVSTAWIADSDELTPTAKLKRRAIHAKYSKNIDRLYS